MSLYERRKLLKEDTRTLLRDDLQAFESWVTDLTDPDFRAITYCKSESRVIYPLAFTLPKSDNACAVKNLSSLPLGNFLEP